MVFRGLTSLKILLIFSLVQLACFHRGIATPIFASEILSDQLIADDTYLKEVIRTQGPGAVIQTLAREMPARGLICHDRAHITGRFAYEVLGSEAFKHCSSECHSGCYHGAAEAFFHDKGTANLTEDLTNLCPSDTNQFFTHQCVHGVGHGLMAWTNYELYDALASCDKLPQDNAQASCWTGVFMENIVGGLASENEAASDGHFTKYLNDDPQYPCNDVDEKYKGSCYFLQTSRMMQLFHSDYAKIAESCMDAPEAYRSTCFQSMGRDVGGSSKGNPGLAISRCQSVPLGDYRTDCLSGAVQDTFWDPSGQSEAKEFCSLLVDTNEAVRCYETITGRAREVLSSEDINTFCASLPLERQHTCTPQQNTNIKQDHGFVVWYKKFIAWISLKLRRSPVAPPAPNTQIILSGEQAIQMKDTTYEPRSITIKVGTRITFQNVSQVDRWPASNIHPTHGIYPEFDPQRSVKPGESWSFIFNKAGIWHMHDHLSPTITGTITVVE